MSVEANFFKLQSAVLRHLFRRPSKYQALSERSWTICPAEARTEQPAFYLEGELERVKGVQEATTMEAELKRVGGGVRHHAATRAHLFTDITLIDGHLFKGAMNHRISQKSNRAAKVERVHMPSAALSSTLMGSIYFGHWLHDDASLHIAARSLAPIVEVARKPYTHEHGYRELLSLSDGSVASGHFGQLILIDDWGQNSDKRRRYQELRSRIRRGIGGVGTRAGSERVFIKRGQGGVAHGRDARNSVDLEAHLVSRGFSVVDPDTMSAQQISRINQNARLIIGVEGSHLAHAFYSIADNGKLVVIQPPNRFNNIFKDLADALGLQYAFIVGCPVDGGFTIDLDRLDKLLELIDPS